MGGGGGLVACCGTRGGIGGRDVLFLVVLEFADHGCYDGSGGSGEVEVFVVLCWY